MNVILNCVPDVSPIPRKQNSELGLNMVLVFSDTMKGVQTLKGKIWTVVQVIGLC